MDMTNIKVEIERLVSRGATEYMVADDVRSLCFPDGRLALELPSAKSDPADAVVRYTLEQIAWREYRQVEGKIVLVTWLTGYDEHDNSRDIKFENPIRVRIDCNTNHENICRWMDRDHLDPVWDVEMVDQDESTLVGMRSFWLYATSRSISGTVEKSDAVVVEGLLARIARTLGLGKAASPPSAARV
jgi:hypothetical protein